MKRFIILALVLTIVSGTSFANNTDGINQRVLTSFSKKFGNAEDVKWEIRKDLYRAKFTLNGSVFYAYFNASGEQVAVSRNISVSQLPINLATELQSGYNQYWLVELFEVAQQGSTTYYATVESSTHITTFKADNASSWYVSKKERKQD
jgi:hypothetical protein